MNPDILVSLRNKLNIPATELLATVSILHESWGGDPTAWVVSVTDSSPKAFTTNHGKLVPWPLEDILEYQKLLAQAQKNATLALELIGNGPTSS